VLQHRSSSVLTLAPKPAARSRLIIGEFGPQTRAGGARGWRLLAAEPLTGTLRAALLGTCARVRRPWRYTPSASAILVMLCVKRATEKPTLSKIV